MAKLAFFGTPQFAVPIVDGLYAWAKANGHTLERVVAQPDKRVGRGKKMQPPPVKAWALEHDIPVLQPETLRKDTPSGEAFFAELCALELDVAVVVAYGRIIPGRVLRTPRAGFVNVHGSLLPRWRGAAPIQRAIEAGDAETGVGIMDMIYALDEGDVYLEERLPIARGDTTVTLGEKLSHLGRDALLEALPGILDGTLEAVPQAGEGVTYASMLAKTEAWVDWTLPARAVENRSNAFDPWPGTQSRVGERTVKLFGAQESTADAAGAAPGTIVAMDTLLHVAAADGAVAFSHAQLPSKKRMDILAVKNGRALSVGDRFESGAPDAG